jgi:hypothetical protein
MSSMSHLGQARKSRPATLFPQEQTSSAGLISPKSAQKETSARNASNVDPCRLIARERRPFGAHRGCRRTRDETANCSNVRSPFDGTTGP